MELKKDVWMLNEIFQLSDRALLRMVNRMFGTGYRDEESLWREPGNRGVTLNIGGFNRYEFSLRIVEGCLQLNAEDRGYYFCYENAAAQSVIQIREPQILYFGKNREEEYKTTLQFPGNKRVTLRVRTVPLEDYSPVRLQEQGLIVFLPFLFYCFAQSEMTQKEREEKWEQFVLRDVLAALDNAFRNGELGIYDVQRLKQLCRYMVWNVLQKESWMQVLQNQELILSTLEVDLRFLERAGHVK